MPPSVMEHVHEAIPSSALKLVPGAGHSVYFEAPDAFNEIVLGFLSDAGYLGRTGAIPASQTA